MEEQLGETRGFFWGEPTASISFCEDKYTVVPWIAEYYNTISCLAFILVGLPFIKSRIRNLAWISIIMGVGSMLLHSTLQQYGQHMDEMSMIALNFYTMKHFYNEISHVYLIPILTIYYKNSHHFLSFFSIFSTLQYLVWREIVKRKHKISKVYYYCYHVSFIVGFTFWLGDHFLCEYVQPHQLHAWWHVFASLTILSGMLAFSQHQHVQ